MTFYLNNKPMAKRLIVPFSSCCFCLLIACGGSDEEAIVQPQPFAEKISNIILHDSLVYFAVEVENGRFELFNVDAASGIQSGISDTFSPGNSLRPIAISDNGLQVGYRADKDNNGIDELYVNSSDGSEEIQLSNSLETGSLSDNIEDHFNWQWMPNDSRILFRSDPDGDGIFQIQSVLPDGTDLQVISAALEVTCELQICWRIAENSSSITFKTESINLSSEISQNLFVATADASQLIQLNQTLNSNSRILDWQYAPDDSLLAYISHNIGEARELYTIRDDATERVQLNIQSISIGVEAFAWSPDSSHIAYTDDSLQASLASLYTDTPDATERVHLIDTFEVANPVVFDWQWSPDSARVAYTADQETAGIFELFTVQTDGQWHRRMNLLLPDNGVVQNEWQWSPDGRFIAYYAEIDLDTTYDELYSSSADASQLAQVNSLHNNQLNITRQHWNIDGSRLIYSTLDDDGNTLGIYSVLPEGNNVVQISNDISNTQSIKPEYSISPDNTTIIYQVDSSDGATSSLHIGEINQSNRVDLVLLGVVSNIQWLSDSSRIIYVVKTEGTISEQLYSILPDGTGQIRLY